MSILSTVTGLGVNQNYQMENSGNSVIDWWPMYRHNLGHSGFSTSDAPETAYLKWTDSYLSYSCINSDPIVCNNRIYISVVSKDPPGTGIFFCLDANDGSIVWSKSELGVWGLMGSVFVKDDNCSSIYVSGVNSGQKGTIWKLDPESGGVGWSYIWSGLLDFSYPFTPIYYNEKIYFIWMDISFGGDFTCHIRCVKDHGDQGKVVWDEEIDDIIIDGSRYAVDAVPAISDGKVYILTDYKIYCFNAETGAIDWVKQRSKMSDLSLAVTNNKIYFGEQGYVTCLNANDGSEVWSRKLDSNPRVVLPPTVVDGKVYVGFIKTGYSIYVYCLNDTEGDELWFKHLFDTSYDTYVSPTTVADDKIYIAGGESGNWGKAFCLDTDDGSILWNYSIDASVLFSPSIANGAFYIGTFGGTLYKFEDKYQNHPPYPPVISGPIKGAPGTKYNYTFVSIDPELDNIANYVIDWGDDSDIEVIEGPFASGEKITMNHTWDKKDTYTIKAKAKDINDLESDWGILKVKIPRNRVLYKSFFNRVLERFERLLERFPNTFPILRQLLGI